MTAGLDYEFLKRAFAEQPLFEDKIWRLTPEPWPLTPEQTDELEQIGQACLEFYRAVDLLYWRAAADKNLLRNRELKAPWVVQYLDRGKPARIVEHGRLKQFRGKTPLVMRPDLLQVEGGYALTELDSVPGGVGLTAFLNDIYREHFPDIVEGKPDMADAFYDTLANLRNDLENPVIAIVVSDEAAVYKPEFDYLAARYQQQGLRVYVRHPDDIMPLGNALCIPVDGSPQRVDIIYRFWELFDVENVSTADRIFTAAEEGEVVVSPPMKAFQEEKLNLALFHHHILEDFWRENLSKRALRLLKRIIPRSWVMDPVDLPPNAVLDAPSVDGKPIRSWLELADASQKERNLIIKASGFHETAWGARSVTLGSDVSRDDWATALKDASAKAEWVLHILQNYHKPIRLKHAVYREDGETFPMEGRVRLCPYYFVSVDTVTLAGVLATFCPADKKIIHGMRDAALMPARLA